MQVIRFAFLGYLVLLSGCASIVEGTTEIIAVSTPPADGARCILTSSEGVYYVTTPGNATVHKTKHDMDILCQKDGFQDATSKVESHFNAVTAGNIIAGGLVGLGVDAATGANYNFPAEIKVPMMPIQSPDVAADPQPSGTTVIIDQATS